MAEACQHTNQTKHIDTDWTVKRNSLTGDMENWRQVDFYRWTCDDCSDVVSVEGPIYGQPRF